jgi:hypothetical protein
MIDEATVEKLKAEHGELHLLRASGAEVVVKPPSRAQWKRFRAYVADERRRPDAVESLLRDCVVYPDAAALDGILEKRPGLAETFGNQVVELAGASGEAEKKVL